MDPGGTEIPGSPFVVDGFRGVNQKQQEGKQAAEKYAGANDSP
jgi:hypothetical protein